MAQRSGFQIDVRMTPEQASEFLTLLADDDEFRKRFESDTQALLAEWGIDISAEALPSQVIAPTKGLLKDATDHLARGKGAMPPPFSPPPPFSHWLIFIALSRAER
jgi:putative modified peptide